MNCLSALVLCVIQTDNVVNAEIEYRLRTWIVVNEGRNKPFAHLKLKKLNDILNTPKLVGKKRICIQVVNGWTDLIIACFN